jgi:hypothetical protein
LRIQRKGPAGLSCIPVKRKRLHVFKQSSNLLIRDTQSRESRTRQSFGGVSLVVDRRPEGSIKDTETQ